MQLESIEISGFKSFGKKTSIAFNHPITGIVGPNGSGKSNVAEAIRFVLGEQSMKSLRGKQGTDLIFKGSGSLAPLGRASVTAIFDNKKNKNHNLTDGVFSYLQFDQIRITREIYADGSNEYSINDTKVRLKDIQELLATANIGSTGHHMISQGEADKVLSANIKERREMLEDALGLKLYQWRIKEAERKLEKTELHLREGEIARREIAPHLNYLRKQVERVEARKEQVNELTTLYHVYLAREGVALESEKSRLNSLGTVQTLDAEKQSIVENIARIEHLLQNGIDTQNEILLREKKQSLDNKQSAKRALENSLIRLEAEERVLYKNLEKARDFELRAQDKQSKLWVEKNIAEFARKEIESNLDQIKWRIDKHEYALIPNILTLLKNTNTDFFETLFLGGDSTPFIALDSSEIENDIRKLADQKKSLEIDIETASSVVEQEEEMVRSLEERIQNTRDSFHTEEKALYEYKAKFAEIDSHIRTRTNEFDAYTRRNDRFVEEIQEGNAIIGSVILGYTSFDDDGGVVWSQQELYRSIERLKIKLEEAQVGNASELTKEHDETLARDAFLRQEIEDLEKTKTDLGMLISDLSAKLTEEFTIGVEKVNRLFSVFFTDMFGGGDATLFEVEREKRTKKKESDDDVSVVLDGSAPEMESGIDVRVALPGKKVRDLSMLSGGERALTSIALLFAISGVNPPPFMVLDETDAALDEANARRYGKSLKHLSEHSKLVVITHNRETMNQAHALYGVTVGKDGASKVLSVMFDEATEYAK